MEFFQACVLGFFVLLHAAASVESVAGPTTASLTGNDWGEAVAVQSIRTEESLVNPDSDYANLQSLLTKNIPGTTGEKKQMVDLLLQLLSEIDLPTLCDVIANDTSRRADNTRRNDKMPESDTETVEIAFPTVDTKPRYGVTAPFAIPYFNILGQSKNSDTEKESERVSTADKGMTPESIVGYHRNMVERVNRGMNAMREYGNKRADYMHSLRRNNNAHQAQFSASDVMDRKLQVDELNELRNLHADDVIVESLPVTRDFNLNMKEVNDSMSSDISMEANSMDTSKSSDESLASNTVWIRSMNVERPKSDLYSRSLLIGDVTGSNNLIRGKRIEEGEETPRLDNNDNQAVEDNMIVRVTTKGEETILPGSNEYPSASSSNNVYTEDGTAAGNSIIFGAKGADYLNTIFNDEKQATTNTEHNEQGKIGQYNILNQEIDYAAENIVNAANNVNTAANTTSGALSSSIFQYHNAAVNLDSRDSDPSTWQSEMSKESSQYPSDTLQNATFESLILGQGVDASIDDFFGADAVLGRLVHLPEQDDSNSDPSTASPSAPSQEVNVTDEKVTFSGGGYLIDHLFRAAGANITTTHGGERSTEQSDVLETTKVLSDVRESVNSQLNGSHATPSPVLTSVATGMNNKLPNVTLVISSVSTEMEYEHSENSSTMNSTENSIEHSENSSTMNSTENSIEHSENSSTMNSTENSIVTYNGQAVRNNSTEPEAYVDSSSATSAEPGKQEEIGTTQKSLITKTYEEENKTSETLALISKDNVTNESNSDGTIEPIEALNHVKVIDQIQLNNSSVNDNIGMSMTLNVSVGNTNLVPQNESANETTYLYSENVNSTSLSAAALTQVSLNASDINSTASVDVQESHNSRGAITLDNFIKMNVSEPYIRYEPSSVLERTEPSLQMFGPYGASEIKPVQKNDVIEADVARASLSEMSIESAKAELEVELKRLGNGAPGSGAGKDLISIMRGNRRGNQRGVSSTSYSSFLSQPVMKSLKRIHEEFRRRGNPQSTAADVAILDDVKLLKNNTSTGSGDTTTVSAAPSYVIADASLADLRPNVTTTYTTKTIIDEIVNPVKSVVQNIDNLIDLLNQSSHRQEQVNKDTLKDEHKNEDNNNTTMAFFTPSFDNNKTEEKNTSWKNESENLKDGGDKRINISSSRFENELERSIILDDRDKEVNSNVTSLIGQSLTSDAATTETQLALSENTTQISDDSISTRSQSENTTLLQIGSVHSTQQDERSDNFTHTAIPDFANSTISNGYEVDSTNYFTNHTLALISSEELSQNSSTNSSLDNFDSETDVILTEDLSNATNATTNLATAFVTDAANVSVTDEMVWDDNSTNLDMASNDTQTNGDIFDYFMPTPFSEDDYSNSVESDAVLGNDPETEDEETRAEDGMLKKYESQFRAYLKSKRPLNHMTSFEDYQNELMRSNGKRDHWLWQGQNNMLYHPKIKSAVKPEASPFLSDDFYKDSKKNNKHRQIARINPWKAFNIELGKEKVKHQKEALNNYRYPSFKIRHHDDLINPSVKDYLWNARPWPKHEKTAPENYFSSSQKHKYGSGFARLNEFLRQRQRDAQFSSSLAEHTRLWGNRFSQGYYGRVMDDQSHAPVMSSYLGLPRDLASYKSAEPKSRSFLGFKRPGLEKSATSPQSAQQKEADSEMEQMMAYSTPLGPPTEVSVNQVDPVLMGSDGRPEESAVNKIETGKTVETNALPDYSMIPPGPTGVLAIDDFKCPGLFGYYTDSDNCSSFFMCSWGVSYRLQCSEGTLWNTVDSVCDWAANVSCDQRKLS
ncbi:hypothetical protein Btru_045165 [Bulinus truncatus]|nr:hypothetical protein Btru_045165 [Bulinus truncatus]